MKNEDDRKPWTSPTANCSTSCRAISRWPKSRNRAIADDLGITEDDVLARLAELKRQNVVRQISAIFDTRRLGYKTTLVAFAYADGDLHDGAIYINRHPGVSHNYAREGSYYNLWFTLAVPPTATWQRRSSGWRSRPAPSSIGSCPPSGSSRLASTLTW